VAFGQSETHGCYTVREIFNPRIVLDSLIFISVVAARWPGPPGEHNLRASGVLPACQCQRRASESANASEAESTTEAMMCLQLTQIFTSLHSDFLFSILFCNT